MREVNVFRPLRLFQYATMDVEARRAAFLLPRVFDISGAIDRTKASPKKSLSRIWRVERAI